MMKVLFKKQIHSCFAAVASTDVYVCREVEMEYLLPPGSFVTRGDWSAQIAYYEDYHGMLIAHTQSDTTLYKAMGSVPMYTIVDRYVEEGWKVQR